MLLLLLQHTRPSPLRRSKVTSRQIAQKAPYPVAFAISE
jgi:hypothetical protein